MNANDIAEMIEKQPWHTNANKVAIAIFVRQQQAEIERLNQRIEFMVENASHHEGIAHAGGFEAGWQSAQAEIEALKEALRMKVILNTHVEKAMRETK